MAAQRTRTSPQNPPKINAARALNGRGFNTVANSTSQPASIFAMPGWTMGKQKNSTQKTKKPK
ncbi:hypothetical protein [Aquabacterium sp.]|uniref:hypothetical protein n=1 Tax=Aquabacterium sp. TaxID=1872578 RepID=UPI0025BBE605|nr:hypothetical protein [Aquabacterium sp.]|tara:strand:- start:967 stop:1155 length:189 start_codon:yes stop_codon:yes gene_type:complete